MYMYAMAFADDIKNVAKGSDSDLWLITYMCYASGCSGYTNGCSKVLNFRLCSEVQRANKEIEH